ncbi:MAG TPA: MaoC family dehydratase N-terminal domain-containing protein [Caulobacteraceae bacterium]|nr:MaoC family dehydratase N-terminal domain-containing protein [Caulobacteraceae bacterium]
MADDLAAWIGRTRTDAAVLEPELARRYAAAMGEPLEVETHFPPLGHWAYFNDAVAPSELGPDGHPKRGRFLPPVTLPRRMFASAEFRFEAPLSLGAPAELAQTIADVRRRSGRTGELVLVDVERRLSQGGAPKLSETQTIVYREAGEATPAVADTGAGGEGELWRPSVVDLFRYSAATYNGHRIHYDQAYVREEEGYPDLVVHGPFTAAKLCGLAARLAGGSLRTFGFRALAPLFVNQPVRLRRGDEPNTVVAVRCDGAVAVAATFASA